MKTSTNTPLALAVAGLALQANAATPTTKCNADNCARAVTGTARGAATLAAHLADCSSFQWATFTPDTFFSTTTIYPQAPMVPRHQRKARQAGCGPRGGGDCGRGGSVSFPTRVPAYASACSGVARYASACSCAGITGGTVTLGVPTVTITETAPVGEPTP